jgi:Protein of unknown function (DUF1194)
MGWKPWPVIVTLTAALIGTHVQAAQDSAVPNSNGAVVDIELILAVDVSFSMELEELALQREGYAQALVSEEFLSALSTGPFRKVAITYVEWSSANDQKTIIPWRIIDGLETAESMATEIAKTPVRRGSRTSISGALNFAMHAFAANPYNGLRRVIDVSGDGPNNSGEPVLVARDAVLAQGVTINGLAVMTKAPSTDYDIAQLDIYYEDCVVGGPGSFAIAIKSSSEFRQAIRTKLVLEVANAQPSARLIQTKDGEPRISCTVGEDRWRQRWGR